MEPWPFITWSNRLVAESHIAQLASPVRHHDLFDPGAIVCDSHDHALVILDRVEIDGLSVDGLLKFCAVKFYIGWVIAGRGGKCGQRHAKRQNPMPTMHSSLFRSIVSPFSSSGLQANPGLAAQCLRQSAADGQTGLELLVYFGSVET